MIEENRRHPRVGQRKPLLRQPHVPVVLARLAGAQLRDRALDEALRRVNLLYGNALFAEKVLLAPRRAETTADPDRILSPIVLRDIRRAFADIVREATGDAPTT